MAHIYKKLFRWRGCDYYFTQAKQNSSEALILDENETPVAVYDNRTRVTKLTDAATHDRTILITKIERKIIEKGF